MHIRRFGLLSTLFPMLVLAPVASAGGPVSPFPWSGAPPSPLHEVGRPFRPSPAAAVPRVHPAPVVSDRAR